MLVALCRCEEFPPAPRLTISSAQIEVDAHRLPFPRLIDAVPAELPLGSLTTLCQTILPLQAHRLRESQIRRGLARAQHQRIQQLLTRLRGRRVVVGNDRACQVSDKLIGDSIFVVYPNNCVVLLGARSRGEEAVCPVTGRDFARLPIDPACEEQPTD